MVQDRFTMMQSKIHAGVVIIQNDAVNDSRWHGQKFTLVQIKY